MIGAFHREGDEYRAVIEGETANVLQRLIREVLVILDEPNAVGVFIHAAIDSESSREQPGDPALVNLLPPMSSDPEEASRMRAFTEDYLRSEKSSRLRKIDQELRLAHGSGVNAVIIPVQKVWEWLAGLNDIRLALAGELQIRNEEDASRIVRECKNIASDIFVCDRDSEVTGTAREKLRLSLAGGMYMAVTWWQDSLLQAVRWGGKTN